MSKRLVLKLAVMVASVGVMTLLQGCGEEESSVVFRFAWMPVGFSPIFSTGSAAGQSAGSAAGQTSAGATGGVTTAGAASAAGGGNQVGGAGLGM